MRTVFFAFTLFFASIMPALGSPLDLSYTHNTALTVPELSEPEASFKLAKTWFLPDWQAGLGSRTDTAPAGSGDRHDLTCSTYGGCLGVPANMTCLDDFSVDGKTCYKSCSCNSGLVLANSSDICQGCIDPCDARTAVSTPYGCEKYFSDCSSKCEKAYDDNCRDRTAVADKGFGCKTYYPDCSSKCQVAYSDNCHKYTAVDAPYGCEKYFSDCSSKCEKAYSDNCRNYSSKPAASSCVNGCAQGKVYSDCASKCSVGCKAKCETGYHLSSDELSCTADGCPAGYEAGKTCGAGYNPVQSGQSGATPCYKCDPITCTEGSTSCSGATVAKENGYYSGESKCYTCLTCEQAGKKTCGNTCIATTKCCNCTSSQKCVNGSCVAKTCADAGGPSCADGQKCENGNCVTTSTSTKCAATLRAQGAQVAETAEELLAISQNLDLFTGSNVIPIFIIGDISVDTLEIYFPRLNLYDGYYAVESGICSLDGETQENKTKLLTSKLIVTNEMYLGPDTVNIFLNNYDINSLFAESSGLFGSLKFYATDSVNSGKIGTLDAGFTSVDFGKNEVSNLEDPTSGLVNLYAPNIDIENLTTNQGVNFNTAYVTINNFNHSGNIIFNSGYVTIDTMTATYLNEILFNAGNSSNRMDIKNLTVEKTSTMVWVLQDATMNIEDFLLKSGNLTIRLNGNSKMFFFNIASLKSNNSTIDTLMTNAYDNNYLYDYSSKYTGSGAHVAQPNFTYSMILGNKNCIGTPQNSTCTTSKLGSIDYNANRILSFSFNEKNKYGSSCSTWNMGTPLTPNYSIDDGVTQTDTSGCISYSFSLN